MSLLNVFMGRLTVVMSLLNVFMGRLTVVMSLLNVFMGRLAAARGHVSAPGGYVRVVMGRPNAQESGLTALAS
jgi:hypothetical protein